MLSHSLTSSDLQRWAPLVVRVMLERDPSADLGLEELLAARVNLEQRPVSRTLRQGLAEGLALLASHGSEPLPDGATCAERARMVVFDLLRQADADASGRTWGSLAAELPLIAEAAPELFLARVLAGSSGATPLLGTMFGDATGRSTWGTSSPHTGLLWALETLCWSPDHLLEATRALAQLDSIDPGGRLSNRPGESLSSVLMPWVRHTSAPLPVRLAAIDQIVRDFPDVGWKLLTSLWPGSHIPVMTPHVPRYRDWKPDRSSVPIPEWLAMIDHIVDCAIREAGQDADRWAELVHRLAPLPPVLRDRIIAALEVAADQIASARERRLALWEVLTNEVERHRRFATTDWAMAEEPLARLATIAERIEPSDAVERYARLFDWRPDIGAVAYESFDQYQAALMDLRAAAVKDTIATGSINGLGRLAERVPVPAHLGTVVALVSGDEFRDTLLSWLQSEGKRSEVAREWASRRAFAEGMPWVSGVFRDLDDNDRLLTVALGSKPTPALWRLVSESSADLADRYWATLSPFGIAPENMIEAASELLDRGRPWGAITALAAGLHLPAEARAHPAPALVVRTLEAAYMASGGPEQRGDSLGYEIGVLLDFLESEGTDREILARLEFAFFRARIPARASSAVRCPPRRPGVVRRPRGTRLPRQGRAATHA